MERGWEGAGEGERGVGERGGERGRGRGASEPTQCLATCCAYRHKEREVGGGWEQK